MSSLPTGCCAALPRSEPTTDDLKSRVEFAGGTTVIRVKQMAEQSLLLLPVQQSVPSAASYITLITVRLLRLETLLHCFNDFTIYVPTASSTLLFLSSVVGSLQGSLVRRKARPNQIGGMMYLLDIKSSPSSIRLNLLTKTTWKLKTPDGILVFRVLVQVCSFPA